ncbi:MAG: hypothetical protein Ct9H90mP21_2300 [Methanobacteriota archaeon]|nr:MAG: hypothetical protein Ct9H90mP21_2300 [Euryarchaeota archaeon]
MILIWEESSTEESSRDALIRALIDGDHESATQTLRECGISLGRYHKHVEQSGPLLLTRTDGTPGSRASKSFYAQIRFGGSLIPETRSACWDWVT